MTDSKWTAIFVISAMLMTVGTVIAAADPPPTNDTPDTVTTAPAGQAGNAPAGQAAELIALVTVFVLAIFVGFEIITKVPPTLHTPLMSGSNAISGITVIGALLLAGAIDDGQAGSTLSHLSKVLAFIAVVFATINVVGGYLVTDRMLRMFKRR